MIGGLTKRQNDVLKFVTAYCKEHEYSPSYEEIMRGIGLTSKSGIHRIVKALEERGYIRKRKDRARSVTIQQQRCKHCGMPLDD